MSDYKDDAVNYAKLVVDLKNEIDRQNEVIKNLQNHIEIQKKMPVPLDVVKQVAEMKEEIVKLKEDLKYYKKLLPSSVIINREKNNNTTRKGSGLR
jgi:hypothetical protein